MSNNSPVSPVRPVSPVIPKEPEKLVSHAPFVPVPVCVPVPEKTVEAWTKRTIGHGHAHGHGHDSDTGLPNFETRTV